MKKNEVKKILIIIAILFLVSSCRDKVNIQTINDLDGKKIGIPVGPISESEISSIYPNAKINFFSNTQNAIAELKKNKIDVIVYDTPMLKHLITQQTGMVIIDNYINRHDYAFAVRLNNNTYKEAIDRTIDLIIKSGIYEDMSTRWFPIDGSKVTMPNIQLSNRRGVLKFGTSAIREPFSYLDEEGKIIGFDIELAHYIAQGLEMDLEIVNMQYAALIPSILASRVDMIGACIIVTDERAKSVTFSKPYFYGGLGALIKEQK